MPPPSRKLKRSALIQPPRPTKAPPPSEKPTSRNMEQEKSYVRGSKVGRNRSKEPPPFQRFVLSPALQKTQRESPPAQIQKSKTVIVPPKPSLSQAPTHLSSLTSPTVQKGTSGGILNWKWKMGFTAEENREKEAMRKVDNRTLSKNLSSTTSSEPGKEVKTIVAKAKKTSKVAEVTPPDMRSETGIARQESAAISGDEDEVDEERTLEEKHLAQRFFSHRDESRRAIKKKKTNAFFNKLLVDSMPDSGLLSGSVKAMAKSVPKKPVPVEKPDDSAKLFKPNGEPVWVEVELPAGQGVQLEDGVECTTPLLANALLEADEELKPQVGFEIINSYLVDDLKTGPILSRKQQKQLNPYADFKVLEDRNQFMKRDTVTYLTAATIYKTSQTAIDRFKIKVLAREDGLDYEPPSRHQRSAEPPKAVVLKDPTLKTCRADDPPVFDLTRNLFYSYDRRNPLVSARALNKNIAGIKN